MFTNPCVILISLVNVCSSPLEQKEQLLLTGNRWGPTAGLGWLGTGSKGTARKQVTLQPRPSLQTHWERKTPYAGEYTMYAISLGLHLN